MKFKSRFNVPLLAVGLLVILIPAIVVPVCGGLYIPGSESEINLTGGVFKLLAMGDYPAMFHTGLQLYYIVAVAVAALACALWVFLQMRYMEMELSNHYSKLWLIMFFITLAGCIFGIVMMVINYPLVKTAKYINALWPFLLLLVQVASLIFIQKFLPNRLGEK